MSDTTIKKVEAASSPRGEMGQNISLQESACPCGYGIWSQEPK